MKIDVSSSLYAAQAKAPKITPSKDDARLKEQTNAFESLILKTLLETSLKLENPLYPKEAGAEIYESMYKDTLANQLSGGFGYSELLFNFLKEQQAGKR